jgi:hypothetical protein
MKPAIILAIILAILPILIVGCSRVQNLPSGSTINITNTTNTAPTISGIQDLMLNEQELQQLGMTSDLNEQDLAQFGITGNGTNCQTDENYTNIVDSSPGQYSICFYDISSLNDTKVIIELQKFANYEALNGSYQYGSLHLYSAQGIISENDYGDQSRFRVNNVNDYMGQLNDPNVFYYHLWICKELYLIHITSSGSSKDAKEHVAKIGRQILSKFG